jgi:hypothetical protein
MGCHWRIVVAEHAQPAARGEALEDCRGEAVPRLAA